MHTAPDRLTAALADRYRVERELGAGGMANVYLAQDLRHDRRVALKVLKPELAAVVGAERFLAEIKTTANLQHPHILALFDSGQVEGTVFYVMPFVEGESLRDRLSREKQLPVDAALAIAREVGDALEYAHERGVIHRDIKPENILLHGGHALVADFGIALAASVTGGSRMTETGMSLGTPAYMSPEQAMGERALDARTDVYALGCVLYEMLTGDPPFTASTAQAIVAKVLTERPAPIVARRERVPEHVEEAILTALEKLPADRFATAAEFIAALAGDGGLVRATSTRSGARHAGARNRGLGVWRAATGVLALVSLALAAALGLRPAGTATSPPLRFEVQVGEPVAALPVAIAGAPDGSSYVYCSSTGAVVLRRWEALAPAPLTGPLLGCVAAAYSPDSRFVAVIGIPSSLQIFSVAGDVPRRELGIGKFGDMATAGGYLDWGADDALYLASPAGVLRVSVADGTSRIVVAADSARTFYAVDVLPGERHALVVTAATSGTTVGDMRVGVLDLRTGTIDSLGRGVIARFAAPDHAVVVRSDGSIAVRGFDTESRQFTGPATVLPDSMAVWPFSGFWQGSLDVAGDGSLYYVRSGFRGSTPALVERSGRATQVAEGWTENFIIPRLSPDGTRMSVEMGDVSGARAVLRDLRTGATRSLGAPAGPGRMSWLPDGSAMSVIADHEGIPSLYRWRVADDVAIPEPRYDPRGIFAAEWSRDGRWLVLRTDDQAAGRADILAVRPGIDSAARPVVATAQFSEYAPTLSPDARWMAYVSNEGGRYEVRVTDFPGGREKWQISSAGGSEPVWSADGRELFYVADDRSLMSASVTIVPEFRVLGQRRLFSTEPFAMYGVWNRNYDVSRDGQRFLMLQRPAEATSSVVVVQRWRSLLLPSDG